MPTHQNYTPGHWNPEVAEGIAVLQRFWEAMERDEYIAPEDGYQFTIKPHWATVQGREQLIANLDEMYVNELKGNKTTWDQMGIRKHPQFFRLSDPMRLAMAQELEKLLVKYNRWF